MKKLIHLIVGCFVLGVVGCKKETCELCYIYTDAPGASQETAYCGTEEEIEAEDDRLQNDCVVLQAAYPQYIFNCGCD